MLDLGLTAFLGCFLLLGFKRPFLWVLCYLYVDIVAPQVISWGILAKIPVSLIAFAAAFLGWLVFDDKRDSRFTFRQGLLRSVDSGVGKECVINVKSRCSL